ncbi:hypothetical protein NC651_036333 [Populus alba x Populus x berolinensis]|nr:hypothetical protein NC651_036333 [Populus alba x Populus x berolinensis]
MTPVQKTETPRKTDRKLESSSNFSINLKQKVEGHHWRIITSAFSHISVIHLVFNMSALWSLGVVEQLGHIGLGMAYYLHYTLVLVVLSGALVLGMYHILIQRFKLEYFRRVTAVGYSCVVFGWMTILSVKQPSSKLDLFGFLSLPISFAPFESLIFTSIIVPQASFLGHLSGIVVGYAIAWGLIHGMNNFWAISMLGWIVLFSVVSLKRSGAYDFDFIEIESVMDPSLPSVRFPGTGRTLQMSALPVEGALLSEESNLDVCSVKLDFYSGICPSSRPSKLKLALISAVDLQIYRCSFLIQSFIRMAQYYSRNDEKELVHRSVTRGGTVSYLAMAKKVAGNETSISQSEIDEFLDYSFTKHSGFGNKK